MDILDWILGSYDEEIVEGGGNPLDMARGINHEEISTRAQLEFPYLWSDCIHAIHPELQVTRWRRRKKRKKMTQGQRARLRKGQQVTRINPKPLNERKLCGWQLCRVR